MALRLRSRHRIRIQHGQYEHSRPKAAEERSAFPTLETDPREDASDGIVVCFRTY